MKDPGYVAWLARSLFVDCERDRAEADAGARGKLLSVVGRVEALHLARTQDEFESIFEQLASPRFLIEFAKMVRDPDVLRLLREQEACILAGHMPQVRSQEADDLARDLVERILLTVGVLNAVHAPAKPPKKALAGFAAWIIAFAVVQFAAYDPDDRPGWMANMAWNFGRRGLMDVMEAVGVPWEQAAGLFTTRDRILESLPVNAAASDATARLLGLQ
jgi:hypothetical protein